MPYLAGDSITVLAPATVANVGSAFDVLGFALESPGDTVTAKLSKIPGVQIDSIAGDSGRLSIDPAKNTAGVSSQALLSELIKRDPDRYTGVGVTLKLTKGLPIGSGLGSSSASSVGGVVAVNELLGAPLSRRELLQFAMEGERIACGAAHADNVAPCLLGGFVLIRSYSPLDLIQLPSPSKLTVAIVTPELELRTSDARKILKRSVPLETAISQWGNVAALVAGIYSEDLALMGRALADSIIEPERGQLIPGYLVVKEAAIKAGALGCSISGSGPSVFALCSDPKTAQLVALDMQVAFANSGGLTSTINISTINTTGARVINSDN